LYSSYFSVICLMDHGNQLQNNSKRNSIIIYLLQVLIRNFGWVY
jgi:hypothetical protein